MYQTNEKSTMHGLKTPHGYKTPHKYPTANGESYTDIFEGLTASLYPTGRVWNMKLTGIFGLLHNAINRQFIRLIGDGKSTLDSLFPDNINFDEDDCNIWEYRLGLITNPNVSIEERREAIKRKMAYPGNVRARQHKNYIEYQLRLAGFNVRVYENGYQDGLQWKYYSPDELASINTVQTLHGGDTQHGGGTQHGAVGFEVIANSIDPYESFSIGGDANLWATFFIGGETLGNVASVPANRLREFKELVIKLKPAHLVAFTFINYV